MWKYATKFIKKLTNLYLENLNTSYLENFLLLKYPYIYLLAYLRGIKREEWVAPIPGLPCLTGL